MKKENYKQTFNKIKPDIDLAHRMKIVPPKKFYQKLSKPTLVIVLATLMISVIALTFVRNSNTNKEPRLINPKKSTESTTVIDEPFLSSIKGLPSSDYVVSVQMNYEADRAILFNDLSKLYRYKNEAMSFAIVKIIDTNEATSKESEEIPWREKVQQATANILQVIGGNSLPETIQIQQNLYGGCVGDEKTNLVRPNGVYVLPLIFDNNKYHVIGDLDFLLEVDDANKVHSHSEYYGFDQFNGQPLSTLVKAIKVIDSKKEDLSLYGQLKQYQDMSKSEKENGVVDKVKQANGELSKADLGYAETPTTIVQVKVTSDPKPVEIDRTKYKYLPNDGKYESYTIQVEKTLLGHPLSYSVIKKHLQTKYPDQKQLKNGNHYLMLLDPDSNLVDDVYISELDDQKLLVSERSVFRDYKTVDDLVQAISRIEPYLMDENLLYR